MNDASLHCYYCWTSLQKERDNVVVVRDELPF
jgi:hypothetical protein